MIRFKRYFIVGTNDSGLHDTMNGAVTDELIMCRDCVKCGTDDCAMHFEVDDKVYQWNGADDFCSWAERKEE